MACVRKHLILELWGCKETLLDSETVIKEMLKKVIEISGVSLLKVKTHKFNPQGLSIVAFLNDSYMSVHSWPEIGYAAVDIYTSTPCVYPECVISVIKDYLGPQRVQVLDFHRGNGA